MVDDRHSHNQEPNGSNPESPIAQENTAASDPDSGNRGKEEYTPEEFLEWFKKWVIKAWPKIRSVVLSAQFWIALATAVMAGSTIVYTNYSKKQWQILEDEQRPWVSLVDPEIVSPLIFDDRGGIIQNIRFTIWNSGHSPASNINIRTKAYMIPFGGNIPTGVRQQFCDNVRFNSPESLTLFIGEKKTYEREGAAISKSEADLFQSSNSKLEFPIIVITCVNYRFAQGQSEIHQTQSIYILQTLDSDGNWVEYFKPGTKRIEADKLRLDEHPMGTIAD